MKTGVAKTVFISLLIFALLALVAIIVWLSDWPYWSYPIILVVISLSLYLVSKCVMHRYRLGRTIKKIIIPINLIGTVRKVWFKQLLRRRYARQLSEVTQSLKRTDICMADLKMYLLVAKQSPMKVDHLQKGAVLLSSGSDFKFWESNNHLYVELIASEDHKTEEKLRNFVAAYKAYSKSAPFKAIIICANLNDILIEDETKLGALAIKYQQAIQKTQSALNKILPLHVILTNMEVIGGIANFFNASILKDKGSAFGFCVDRQEQFASLPEFVSAAYASIYRSLNLLRLTLPMENDDLDHSLVYFTPEKIKSSKSKVSRFLEAMMPSITTSSISQIGSLYFTADTYTKKSHHAVSLETSFGKKCNPGSLGQKFFNEDLFSQIIPNLDYLKSIPLPNGGWSDLYLLYRKRILLALFVTVFVYMTTAMYQNRQDLLHLKTLNTVYTEKASKSLEPYTALSEYGKYIESIDAVRAARWIGDIGFTQTDNMLKKMKRHYTREFSQKIFQSAEDYLDRTLDLIGDVPDAQLVFQHINFLHNRIGLLQSDWLSLSTASPVAVVTNIDYRLTMPNVDDDSLELAEFMSTNYLKYLKWQTDKNEIQRMQQRDQNRLHRLIMHKEIGTTWLSQSIINDATLPEYSLKGLTTGFADITAENDVSLDLAYSKHGRDALLAIIGDIESSQGEYSSSDKAMTIPVSTIVSSIDADNTDLYANYLDKYNAQYVAAWKNYLSFFKYGFRSSSNLDSIEFVKILEAGNSPYNKLFARAYQELTPIRDSMILNGESVPGWLQHVLNVALTIQNSKLLDAKPMLVNLPSMLGQAKTLVKQIGTMSQDVSLQAKDDLVKTRISNYQDYSSMLSSIIDKTHQPAESYELLKAYLDNTTKTTSGDMDLISKLLSTIQKIGEERKNSDRQIANNILQAQLFDVLHITLTQATNFIQSSWMRLYSEKYDRHSEPMTLLKQFTQKNKFLSFHQINLNGLVSRDRRGKYSSEQVFGEKINFVPEYLKLLSTAESVSTLTTPVAKVVIAAVPTGINSDSKAVPKQTRLKINCGKQEFILTNKNYRIEESIEINPLECTEVSIEIQVGTLTLTKRYLGDWSYFKFRKDFEYGEKIIPARELDVSDGYINDYNITQITVGYRIKESSQVGILAGLREISFPEDIINTKNPIVRR